MKPAPTLTIPPGDALDALIDLAAHPSVDDDRRAAKLEAAVYREQKAAADAQDRVGFERAAHRAVAAAYFRARICESLIINREAA